MWLDVVDLHPSLQKLMKIKVCSNSEEADFVLEEMSNARLSLQEVDGVVEAEIRKLNLLRVQTSLRLVAVRQEATEMVQELQINQTQELLNLITTCQNQQQKDSRDEEDEVSGEAMKAAFQLVLVNSASNPPGSLKLLQALQRVKLVLESVKVNRGTLYVLLTRFLDTCHAHLAIVSDNQHQQLVSGSINGCKWGRTQLIQRFTDVDDVSNSFHSQDAHLQSQIAATVAEMSVGDEDSISSRIAVYLSCCHESLACRELFTDILRPFEVAVEDIFSELDGLAGFLEENWLRDRIANICNGWTAAEGGFRLITRQVIILNIQILLEVFLKFTYLY